MSLNTAHASGGVLIYSGERILIFYDGVEMAFDMDGDMPHFKGNKKGRAYLTTHRVIFNNRNAKDALQSFSMPFHGMKEVELEQPIFGANYIKGKVKAEPNGNWNGSGKWKMYFTHGGAIEFGKAMLDAGRIASRYFSQQPPVYTPPTGPYYQAPPDAYCMPQAPLYSFVPTTMFPTAPPYDSVYMAQAPPPYPGIDPSLNQYPPPPQQAGSTGPNTNAHNAKAAEAAGSAVPAAPAYYNPSDPHNMYAPQAPPQYNNDMPPPYSEASKKSQ